MDTINQMLTGKSNAIENLRTSIRKIASSNASVRISGEIGTGKTLVAHLIHKLSSRSKSPFVNVNLGTLNSSLAVSEIFGYEEGAFTGAKRKKTGLIEHANNGTLYLEEIGYAPVDLQLGILHVLQEGTYRSIGSISETKIDIRLISSSTESLENLVEENKFREDFFYRISIIVIKIPPLRERAEDIPLLIQRFTTTQKIKSKLNLAPEAMDVLLKYNYPGNVRELFNILHRATILSSDNIIRPENLSLIQKKIPPPENYDLYSFKSANYKKQISMLERELDLYKKNSLVASPIWQGRSLPTEGDYCFVLMPFSNDYDLQNVYKNHVKLVIENKCGLRCERADDIYNISGVMQSIWEGINRARLIIADVTGRNPNVFYELGIAHTLGKPVIIITQSMDYVPFDLRHMRCIVYEYKPSLIEKLEKALERTITTVLSSTDPPSLDIVRN